MKKVTLKNYKSDKYYPKVVKAFDSALSKKEIVTPIDIFLEIGNLTPRNLELWRNGKAPYLERVINGNLSKFSRILSLIGFHAHDLNLPPCHPNYSPYVKGQKRKLIYTRSGAEHLESKYKKSFRWNKKQKYTEWKSETKPGEDKKNIEGGTNAGELL